MPSILQKIIATKRQEIAQLKAQTSLSTLESQAQGYAPKGFAQALTNPASSGIIAEIKRASPSKGMICANFDPAAAAIAYQQAGAACLSVLTDKNYFQGDDSHLQAARQAVALPILRKDFIIDPVQIAAAKALGADCILLIMACLSLAQAQELHSYARSLALDVLLEIHNENELQQALQLPQDRGTLYGINNRNLNSFAVDLQTSVHLAKILRQKLPSHTPTIVSESGIHSASDVRLLQSHGIFYYLIGEQFMRTGSATGAGGALSALLGAVNAQG